MKLPECCERASADASCVFGFIYAQAEDYFWQIEDNYIRSLGRAAEVYGVKSLPDDLVNRALEITQLSKDEYKNAAPKRPEQRSRRVSTRSEPTRKPQVKR